MEQKHLIKIENFEGPLDLLCYLIDKNKMDIFDIKIDEITEQYIQYLEQMEQYNLEITSEFLVMASTLLYLKSKRLLPKPVVDDEEEITEEQLARQIFEYKKYKEFSELLRTKYDDYSRRMFKLPDNVKLPKQKIDTQFEKDILVGIYYEIVKRNSEKINYNHDNVNKLLEYEKVTVRSKAREILQQLLLKPKFIFNTIFQSKKVSKLEKVTSFLSLLELAKIKRITVSQTQTFGDIEVEKLKK